MSHAVYAIVNSDGFITALVNALLLPEIANQAGAVPAPSPDPFPSAGKVWRLVDGAWSQVPDPLEAIYAAALPSEPLAGGTVSTAEGEGE